jgi:hypothetical protein
MTDVIERGVQDTGMGKTFEKATGLSIDKDVHQNGFVWDKNGHQGILCNDLYGSKGNLKTKSAGGDFGAKGEQNIKVNGKKRACVNGVIRMVGEANILSALLRIRSGDN